jgi:hypothetical protein
MAALPDYTLDVEQPFMAAAKGFQLGFTTEKALQDAQIEAQNQRAEQQRKQQFQSGISSFFAKPPEQRKYDDLASLMVGANKQQFDALKQIGDNMNAEKKEASQRFTGQTLLALEANPDVAIGIIDQRINAETDPGQKQAFTVIKEIAKVDPKRAGIMLEELGAATFGKTWYDGITAARGERRDAELAPSVLSKSVADADAAVAAALTALEAAANAPEKFKAEAALATAQAEAARIKTKYAEKVEIAGLNKTNWDIKNLQDQMRVRSVQLNLDTQKVAAEVQERLANAGAKLSEIPTDARKLINESAVSAAASRQSAGQFNDLAKRLEAAGGNYGVASSASDFMKKLGGFEGGLTQLKQEYTRLRNSSAIKSLPPGPATDKDIQMVLEGFPSSTARAGTLASFLRGMAKLQEIDASIGDAKTDWLANNNGVLTRAKTDFIAGNYAAKPGESFNDFTQRIIGDVSKRYDPSQANQPARAVDRIPTDQDPQPGAAQADVRSRADAIIRGVP